MEFIIKKNFNYRYFLLGIIVFWMFEVVWASFSSFFFFLENLPMNPIAVVVGKSILYLLVFYLLFRKPKILDIKWVHLVILIGFVVLMNVLDYYLMDRFFELHSLGDNQMDRNIPNYLMRNVRKWTNLVTSFLMIGFVWWRYDSEPTASDTEISVVESRSYYGGMLFSITIGYILSLINKIGGFCWEFVSHPIFEEVITCLLLVLLTIGAIYLLMKKRIVVLPIVAILAIVLAHFFFHNYLYNILQEHFDPNLSVYEHMSFFAPAFMICDWAFFIATFILYRKEMKQSNM